MYFSFLKTRRFLFSQFLCLQTMVPISNAISDDVTKMELTSEEKDMLTKKFKGPCKSFGYRGLKLLPGIRVIAEGLDLRPRPKP